MTDPLAAVSTRQTPQNEKADARQEKNDAGGYTFTIDDMARLRRFLVLGTDGGTYYASAADLTKDNAGVVLDLARTRTADLVAEIVAVSRAGRAPKQNPTLFALAAACSLGDDDGRRTALAALPLVARTGTHLFLFARYVEQFRGWGRGLRRAVADWYLNKPVEDVAFQAVKYQQREGWSHRDLLRLAHPETGEDSRNRLFRWILGRETELDGLRIVEGYQRAQAAGTPDEVAGLVTEYGLSWEMLPDAHLNTTEVWEALLAGGMPQTALMRQLPRLTRLGMLTPSGSWAGPVAERLADPERLRKARVHPVNVLVAQRTYASGHGARGSAEWTPSRPIVDALDSAFYAAFGAVEPTGKRMMLALDVSGSMTSAISGMPLTCREASAALALVTAATEQRYELVGFTSGRLRKRHGTVLRTLPISPRQRLDDVIRTVSDLPFGGTDCALPMLHALDKGLAVDTFVVYTDNETWAGTVHPHQALRQYRKQTGIDAKLVVVGMTATRFSIADPSDPGMLDVAGFDAAVPNLITDFARGL
ncbi:TROVE domain-containing protein [Actinophytocola xanthii]|uniref:RNA-binding protein n=1 Tax=Actinophytocola xanthii TaxID=1912961 RepID=A0A1Q8CPX5_9PSEU|nr:TROVE domain-containing protein [Actinophytocola xanthii]OLF16389.1 RNA-binding protein [Actinophytocola xanthii]